MTNNGLACAISASAAIFSCCWDALSLSRMNSWQIGNLRSSSSRIQSLCFPCLHGWRFDLYFEWCSAHGQWPASPYPQRRMFWMKRNMQSLSLYWKLRRRPCADLAGSDHEKTAGNLWCVQVLYRQKASWSGCPFCIIYEYFETLQIDCLVQQALVSSFFQVSPLFSRFGGRGVCEVMLQSRYRRKKAEKHKSLFLNS